MCRDVLTTTVRAGVRGGLSPGRQVAFRSAGEKKREREEAARHQDRYADESAPSARGRK